jgi:uncharacterized protein (TIGR02246 family)
MRRRHRLLSASLLALSALGCDRTAAVDTAAEERAINAVREREIGALRTGAVDSLLAVMATDAVVMPPNEPIVTGPEAIRTWHQNFATQFSVDGRYVNSQVSVLGDWAIERYDGVMRFTPKAGGPPTEHELKGVHIYRRQSDGSWRIAQDIWNANAPPAATSPTQ